MAFTEFTTLRLKARELTPSTEELLRQAEVEQRHASGYETHFMRQVEDPSYLHIIGGWPSTAECEKWTSSDFSRKLAEHVDLESRVFFDIDPAETTIPLDAGALGFSWCTLRAGQEQKFERDYEKGWAGLEKHTGFKAAGGWRINKQNNVNEFMIFSGWHTVKAHHDFSLTTECQDLKSIRVSMTSAYVKHANKDLGTVATCPPEYVNPVWSAGIPTA